MAFLRIVATSRLPLVGATRPTCALTGAFRVALGFRDVPPNTTPATIVVDRQGRIAAVFRKALLREELEPVVRRVAAEQT